MKISKAANWMHIFAILATGSGLTLSAGCSSDDEPATDPDSDTRGDSTLSFSTPSDGDTVEGVVTIKAKPKADMDVASVKFFADDKEIAAVTSEPWSTEWDTSDLSSGSYKLKAVVEDADGKTTSQSITVKVGEGDKDGGSKCGESTELFKNRGFESGSKDWKASSNTISDQKPSEFPARTGSQKVWFGGYDHERHGWVAQTVSIPSGACKATLSYWVRVVSDDTSTDHGWLTVEVRNSSGKVLEKLSHTSNQNASSSYQEKTFDLTGYAGETIEVRFEGGGDDGVPTSFFIDDTSLSVEK